MADVKPDEISAILREQLSNFKSAAELEEVGTVLQVGDGIARVYGLTNARAGELVEFMPSGTKAIVLNLEEDNVGVVLMGPSDKIKEGDTVKRTGVIASIKQPPPRRPHPAPAAAPLRPSPGLPAAPPRPRPAAPASRP